MRAENDVKCAAAAGDATRQTPQEKNDGTWLGTHTERRQPEAAGRRLS